MEVGWLRKDEVQTSCGRVNREDRGLLGKRAVAAEGGRTEAREVSRASAVSTQRGGHVQERGPRPESGGLPWEGCEKATGRMRETPPPRAEGAEAPEEGARRRGDGGRFRRDCRGRALGGAVDRGRAHTTRQPGKAGGHSGLTGDTEV